MVQWKHFPKRRQGALMLYPHGDLHGQKEPNAFPHPHLRRGIKLKSPPYLPLSGSRQKDVWLLAILKLTS